MNWFVCALVAAFIVGIAPVFQKLSTCQKEPLDTFEIVLIVGIMDLLVGLLGFLIVRPEISSAKIPGYIYAAITGLLFGIGSVLITLSFIKGGLASYVQTIVNANTLVTIVLGLLFLGEYKHLHSSNDWIRFIIGSGMVVIGIILLGFNKD